MFPIYLAGQVAKANCRLFVESVLGFRDLFGTASYRDKRTSMIQFPVLYPRGISLTSHIFVHPFLAVALPGVGVIAELNRSFIGDLIGHIVISSLNSTINKNSRKISHTSR